jgi:DnaJ-domain-containing protein 1
MLDYFVLLNAPRRPWLDVDGLKQRFLALSAETHPDRAHNAGAAEKAAAHRSFTELNAAWQCLREPKERLGHLLELEMGARPRDAQDVPQAAMELFFEVGRICREADVFLAARSKTSSPLVKAGMFGRGMELTERLQTLQRRIGARRDELMAELKGMNAAWEAAPEPGSASRAAALPLEELEGKHRMFSYIARWTGQIQERAAQLSF